MERHAAVWHSHSCVVELDASDGEGDVDGAALRVTQRSRDKGGEHETKSNFRQHAHICRAWG